MGIYIGTDGAEILWGDANINFLYGGAGDDYLIGSGGFDVLVGGAGADTLSGGSGGDLYMLAPGASLYTAPLDRILTWSDSDALCLAGPIASGANYGEYIEATIDDARNRASMEIGFNGKDYVAVQVGMDVVLFAKANADANIYGVVLAGVTLADIGFGNIRVGTDRSAAVTPQIHHGYWGMDLAIGGSANDSMNGDASGDLLLGEDGNDTLRGGGGDDTLYGGAGDDLLTPGFGYSNTVAAGGTGIDTVSYADMTFGVKVSLAETAPQTIHNTLNPGQTTIAGVENLTGSDYDDTLTGDTNANVLLGGGGDDEIVWGAGDAADGGAGTNTLHTMADADLTPVSISGFQKLRIDHSQSAPPSSVTVTMNAVQLFGFTPNLEITGSSIANHIVIHGDGNLVNLSGWTFADWSANDTITVAGSFNNEGFVGSSQADLLMGGDGNDQLRGGGGNDLLRGEGDIDRLYGGAGDDTLDGGSTGVDLDTADYSDAVGGVSVNLSFVGAQAVGGGMGLDTLVEIEHLHGGDFNDSLSGDHSDNALSGGMGNDSLSGDFGNDVLNGGDGDDTMLGVWGNDQVDGGAGIDTYRLFNGRGDYSIHSYVFDFEIHTRVSSPSFGLDTLSDVEILSFDSNATFALAGIQQNHLAGIDGQSFDDVLIRSASTGQIGFIDMIGQAAGAQGVIRAVTGALPVGWTAVGSGDLDGDGRAETIVQNPTGGLFFVNTITGSVVWGTISAGLPSEWRVVGLGDMTRDGSLDVVIRSSVSGNIMYAEMDGSAFSGWGNVFNMGTGWRAAGIGDYDRDGDSDVLVQETATGTTYFVQMQNGAFSGWGLVTGGPGGQWVAKETADLNGDGYFDVVFQNSSTSQVWAVNMAGGVNSGWITLTTAVGWDVVGSGDYDNDGYADILVQSPHSGDLFYINVDNGVMAGWGNVRNGIGTDWVAV